MRSAANPYSARSAALIVLLASGYDMSEAAPRVSGCPSKWGGTPSIAHFRSRTESIHIPLPEQMAVEAAAPGNAPGLGDDLDAALHHLLHLRMGLLAAVAQRLR
jgi:hypothetical protein